MSVERMGVVELGWQELMHEICSGRRVVDRCFQDRMRMYPVDLASNPGSRLLQIPRLRRRINRSTIIMLVTMDIVETKVNTNEDKDTVCILLPSIGQFLVFFLCPFYIHVEKWL
jgi:hypothetical protein